MYRTNLKLVHGVFGALVVGSLGFGATQALATPDTAPQAALFCNFTQRQACMADCADEGKSFVSCSVSGGSVNCVCS
jgi:hypothetical protein